MKNYLLTINFILPVDASTKAEANAKGLEMIASFQGVRRPTIIQTEENKIKYKPADAV